MLSATKLAFKAASGAGLLPVFGWTLLIVAALSLGFGGWAGMRWQKGADAIADNAQFKAQRDADAAAYAKLLATAKDLQQDSVDNSLAFRQAAGRMDAIAQTLEQDRETNRRFLDAQRSELETLLARRPDLRDLHLGDDVLQHWNRSNAGAAAGGSNAPAARPAGQPAKHLPATAPGAQRPDTSAPAKPRRGGGSVSQLQRSQHLTAGSGGRMAAQRLGLVLPGGRAVGAGRNGVPA